LCSKLQTLILDSFLFLVDWAAAIWGTWWGGHSRGSGGSGRSGWSGITGRSPLSYISRRALWSGVTLGSRIWNILSFGWNKRQMPCWTCWVQLSVFTSYVIKTKNLSHSINKFKSLGYDRSLQYKQPRQESGLCWFSIVCYSQKCVSQIYRALHGDAKHGGRDVIKTFVVEVCYWNEDFYSRALTHWDKCFF